MAWWFFCSGCQARFPLPPEEQESDRAYFDRARITARVFCPKCGEVCDPCVCKGSDNSDSLGYNSLVPTGARRI